jgi:hypothetical protein
MRRFDVFNGDADGICALHQLRLAQPAEATLVTGLKHEIRLLERVPARAGDEVTVLDISLERNRQALLALLGKGVRVRYFDHHHAGDIPEHPGLVATIDAGGLVCTSELVDAWLGGRFRAWAVVAAFGDNLGAAAARLAASAGIETSLLERLRMLGECLNYNAYGYAPEDALVAPEDLYRIVHRHADPAGLLATEPVIAELDAQRGADLDQALAHLRANAAGPGEPLVLPGTRWARRVMGTLANRLARDEPGRAHAVVVPLPDGGFGASVRVPSGMLPTASEFCRGFPSGGGRTTAGGVERLDEAGLEALREAFSAAYG